MTEINELNFSGITYQNSEISDWEIYNLLPEELKNFYSKINGLIAFNGGLHIRGCTENPKWHSIYNTWFGNLCLSKKYRSVLVTDIPFAQDCMGDQFILREKKVFKLNAETDIIENLELNFYEFLDAAIKNPVDFLSLFPLLQFQYEGGELRPGQLLNVYPPFFMANPSGNYVFKAIPMEQRINYLTDIAKQIRDLPDGTFIEIKKPKLNNSL